MKARIAFLKAMDASERGEVMRRLPPKTQEETLSRMLEEHQ